MPKKDDLEDIDLEAASKSRSKSAFKMPSSTGGAKTPGKEPVQKASKVSKAPASKSGGGAKFKAPKAGKISVPKGSGGGIKVPHSVKGPQPSGAFKLKAPAKQSFKKRGR